MGNNSREETLRERAAVLGLDLRESSKGHSLVTAGGEIDLDSKTLDEVEAFLELREAAALIDENRELIDGRSSDPDGPDPFDDDES